MFLRVLILTGILPLAAGADIMMDAPAAPAPRFDGHVTRADSRNALNSGDEAMARGTLPPDLIEGLIAVGLISAAAAYGAEAAMHRKHEDRWDDWDHWDDRGGRDGWREDDRRGDERHGGD